MRPKICIVGSKSLTSKAKEVVPELAEEADFLFIESVLEAALPALRKIEGVADIVVAGPSTRRLHKDRISIPIVSFKPTFPDLIRAVKEAKAVDDRVGLCLSRDDPDFDIPLLSNVMGVRIFLFCRDTEKECEEVCLEARGMGLRVVIGWNFTVEAAERTGLKGILLYEGKDMLRTSVHRAIEICQLQREGLHRVSQLAAVVNHFTDGLVLTDERGRVILSNPLANRYLGIESPQGKALSELLRSQNGLDALERGRKVQNVVERENLVANYIPVRSPGRIHGLVCTLRKVGEIQDAEFTIRRKLHGRGFVAKYRIEEIVGESRAIQSCKQTALRFAEANGPILVTGESGTGKELFAHCLHTLSPRRKGPFVAINCATLPSELLESELFGYEKGAFTGARAAGKEGLIELAHRGTLFLDEITTLNYALQAKLLRLLSEQEILKLGSDRIVPVDIRVLAATNDDIEALVQDRRFREDLYYRLSTFRLHIPPLRERPEDLVPLFLHFVGATRKEILPALRAEEPLLRRVLTGEPLRGNVRELENVAKRFCLLYGAGSERREIENLLLDCFDRRTPSRNDHDEPPSNLKTALQRTEKELLEQLSKRYRNKAELSRILAVDRTSLWRKLKKHGIRD